MVMEPSLSNGGAQDACQSDDAVSVAVLNANVPLSCKKAKESNRGQILNFVRRPLHAKIRDPNRRTKREKASLNSAGPRDV